MKNQKSAALARNRDQLIDLVDSSKLKLANTVKVYKEFSSVVKFLDDKGQDVVLTDNAVSAPPVLKDKVTVKGEKTQADKVSQPVIKQNIDHVSDTALASSRPQSIAPTEPPEEKGKSHYWDTKFV